MAEEPLIWTETGPRSAAFGDIYYSLEDGLAESRAVFLTGCGLPQAWAGRSRFTIGELGFGTGLNIAALLHLWRRHRPEGARLSVFSLESFPVAREDAARALAAWPDIAEEARALLHQWPGARRGFHRIALPDWGVTIDVAIADVGDALDRWQGQADAWFLDGFSPALNPGMWSEAVLAKVAARSAPRCVAATFTVAGAVRRGLEAAGFEVAKRPGHGRKRERLEARLPGRAVDAPPPPKVAIIGAGIAGAALARAFRAQGVDPLVIAGQTPAASGNPAALVTPGLDAGDPARARLYAEGFARAVQLYSQAPQAIIALGAAKLESDPRDARRFDAVAIQDIFEPGRVNRVEGGLRFEDGLVIEPQAVLPDWLGPVTPGEVTALDRLEDGWRLGLGDGGEHRADVVILAAGWGNQALWPGLNLQAVRGQASWAEGVAAPEPTAFGAYALPTRSGVLFGATHDRKDTATDVRAEDHARNLASLARGLPDLATALEGRTLHGRAAIRAATPDRLPVAGELEPGLWALGGLGSRGFATAPLLGEHIAAKVLGLPSPMAGDIAQRLSPERLRVSAG